MNGHDNLNYHGRTHVSLIAQSPLEADTDQHAKPGEHPETLKSLGGSDGYPKRHQRGESTTTEKMNDKGLLNYETMLEC